VDGVAQDQTSVMSQKR